MKYLITSFVFVLKVLTLSAQTNEAPSFSEFKQNPTNATLPDYSYAGYHFGADGIPDVQGSIFDVTQYGAIPNDNIEDFDGIQAAIIAAENAGGGIVFFPPGQFLINEITNRRKGILISKSNIILRGSGSGAGGTELFMRNYMLPGDSTKMWTVPKMFTFSYYQSSSVRTQITMDAKRGDRKIIVANGSRLNPGSFIKLTMQNPLANNELLGGLKTYPEWTTTNASGVSVNETHKIVSIIGNEVILAEPLHTNITTSYGWNVVYQPLASGLGVEDIWFRGNFTSNYQHHKDFINDSGWGFLRMERADNGWVRRIRLTDVTNGITIVNSYACSVLHIRIDGNPGHTTVGGENSYGLLFGFIDDATNSPGMYHGPATAARNAGQVIWRYKGQARSGPDFHASWPYCTLVDASNSKYVGNGGDVLLLPNHMKDLTYWNHKEIGSTSNIAFWEDHVNPPYGRFPPIVKPNIIGWQGTSTFDTSTLGVFESYGEAVSPESLYEAQLTLRLGSLPTWINEAKEVWSDYLISKEWSKTITSIKENVLMLKPNINLFVNSDKGSITIQGDCTGSEYAIYSVTSSLVKSGILLDDNQIITLHSIKAGMYIFTLKLNETYFSYKIVL